MKWISVKDKLPEHEDYVLTLSRKEALPCISYYKIKKKEWICIGIEGHECDVKYWMPLPDDPE